MLFTFKRDDEGRERIYVGDVCVARFIEEQEDHVAYKAMDFERLSEVPGVNWLPLGEAIERADEAGFWDKDDDGVFIWTEGQIEVTVANNAFLSVTIGKDQS